jgi:hypothetical protein
VIEGEDNPLIAGSATAVEDNLARMRQLGL